MKMFSWLCENQDIQTIEFNYSYSMVDIRAKFPCVIMTKHGGCSPSNTIQYIQMVILLEFVKSQVNH